MAKYTTIKDIASALGVSVSTVSRALSDNGQISRAMVAKVKAMADEMNYHPNLLARNLSSKRSGVIGIIVPELETDFFPRIIMGIQDELSKEGFRIHITQSSESAEKERENLELLCGSMVEGLIVSVTKEGGNEHVFMDVIKSGIPVVFFNRVYNLPRASKVIINDSKQAYISVRHLFEQGCRKIAHLSGPQSLKVTQDRSEGYMTALKEFGESEEDGIIIDAGISISDGYDVVKSMMEKSGGADLPDGLFCFNDNIAIGAMKALKEAGKRIPEDVAVVGFSETGLSTVFEPNLTTTAQPRYKLGVSTARVIVEQIRTKSRSLPTNLTLDAEFHVRESSRRKG